MSTEQQINPVDELAAIKARVADEYWRATEGQRHDLGTFSDLALADLRTLLRIVEAQEAELERLKRLLDHDRPGGEE